MPKTADQKLTELRATQVLLQKSHDYIEANGFDINNYGRLAGSGACCYIGSVRKVAGLDPDPPYRTLHGAMENTAPTGDGPELVRAFKILDSIVKRRLTETRRARVEREWTGPITGRYVEAYGFQFQEENGDDDGIFVTSDVAAEAEEALRVFRTALTKVYKKIENLEGKLQHA